MYPQAIAYLEKATTLTRGAPPAATLLADVRALAGDPNSAMRLIEEYTGRRDITPIFLAALYMDVGDNDHAFEYLDKAVEERSFASDWISVNPGLYSLHSDPRWAKLLRKMNLPN
jgi:tetratricopeptide (TPR) repeat protein